MSIHPYLFMTKTCKEAFTRYHEILGGELQMMTFGDLPPDEESHPQATPDMVMHVALVLPDGELIMGSDDPGGDGTGVRGAAINITLADEAEATRIFEGLSDGGEIEMPLGATFWSPLFGSCRDRFGVSWMVNVEPAEA